MNEQIREAFQREVIEPRFYSNELDADGKYVQPGMEAAFQAFKLGFFCGQAAHARYAGSESGAVAYLDEDGRVVRVSVDGSGDGGFVSPNRAIPGYWKPLYAHPAPAVPEWKKGAPEIDYYAILHVPMRGYQDFCVIGAIDDTGSVHDMCGDNLGFEVGDIAQWVELPAMLAQATRSPATDKVSVWRCDCVHAPFCKCAALLTQSTKESDK